MNEAELITAFQGCLELNNQIFFGYVSLISGFLVMSHLVADKISAFLATIAVVLFSLVSAQLIFQIFLNRNDAEEIMAHLLAQRQLGIFDLDWLGTNPSWSANVSTFLYITTTIGGYFACISFFFYKRRSRHDESQ